MLVNKQTVLDFHSSFLDFDILFGNFANAIHNLVIIPSWALILALFAIGLTLFMVIAISSVLYSQYLRWVLRLSVLVQVINQVPSLNANVFNPFFCRFCCDNHSCDSAATVTRPIAIESPEAIQLSSRDGQSPDFIINTWCGDRQVTLWSTMSQ